VGNYAAFPFLIQDKGINSGTRKCDDWNSAVFLCYIILRQVGYLPVFEKKEQHWQRAVKQKSTAHLATLIM